MGDDLRSMIFSATGRLDELSALTFASVFSSRESVVRDGEKERRYVVDFIGDLGYKLGIYTKKIRDEVVMQFLALTTPDDEVVRYCTFNLRGQGVLVNGDGSTRVASPQEIVDLVVNKAYASQY